MNKMAVCLSTMVVACVGRVGARSNAPVGNSERETSATPEAPQVRGEQTHQPAEPFPHERDKEYQNGLAELLSMAPLFGAKLITSAYRVGYTTGLDEADASQSFMDGEVGAVGCRNGFTAIRDYFVPQGDGEVAPIQDICANRRPKAEVQGARFSEWRLKEAQWAGEHLKDPREIKALITIYVVGYNMGFAHEWEAVDQETHVETVATDRCEQVVQKIQPPLSPAHLVAASSKCIDGARATKEQFGHGLKCLLANNEMNGDLSGQALKAGCPRK